MQTQTITATTETVAAAGALFKVTTIEAKQAVICDICGCRGEGTKEQLKAEGWFLGKREEFCFSCND